MLCRLRVVFVLCLFIKRHTWLGFCSSISHNVAACSMPHRVLRCGTIIIRAHACLHDVPSPCGAWALVVARNTLGTTVRAHKRWLRCRSCRASFTSLHRVEASGDGRQRTVCPPPPPINTTPQTNKQTPCSPCGEWSATSQPADANVPPQRTWWRGRFDSPRNPTSERRRGAGGCGPDGIACTARTCARTVE